MITSFEQIESPGVIVFPERVKQNIQWVINRVGGNTNRLRPHIKTHKTKEVNELLLAAGIVKFKAATIAEAELLALSKAPNVLISMQLVGPNLVRFVQLIKQYPHTQFAALCDAPDTLEGYENAAKANAVSIDLFVDLNVGMNRTGVVPAQAMPIIEDILNSQHLQLKGIHGYDGHIRDKEITDRKAHAQHDLMDFWDIKRSLDAKQLALEYVVGGTPSFLVHADEPEFTCSPGTFVFSDAGYEALYPAGSLQQAVYIVSRIISKPTSHTICLDMGHKAVAPENPINNRVRFINHPEWQLVSQSEEHGIVEVGDASPYKIGEVVLMQPYHVCPTINLTQKLQVIENGQKVGEWEVLGRNRRIGV